MRLPHAKPNKSSNVFRTGMNTDPNRRHSVCLFVCLFCWKGFWEATRGSHWDWDPTGCSIYNAFPTGKKKKLLRDAFTASLDYYPTPPIRFPQELSAFGKVSKLFGSLGTVQRTGLGLASAVLWMKTSFAGFPARRRAIWPRVKSIPWPCGNECFIYMPYLFPLFSVLPLWIFTSLVHTEDFRKRDERMT